MHAGGSGIGVIGKERGLSGEQLDRSGMRQVAVGDTRGRGDQKKATCVVEGSKGGTGGRWEPGAGKGSAGRRESRKTVCVEEARVGGRVGLRRKR